MNAEKNLLIVLGEWWQQRQANRSEHRRSQWQNWLPSRGNVLFTLVMIAILLWAQSAGAVPFHAESAASTGTVAYQGRLADSSGNPLTQTLNMSFRLYSASTGGAPLWTEQWTGSNGVKVSDGLFNVMLGSLTPIAQSLITGNSNLFLGITVGTDDEMTPRVQLGSVPFAVQALTVPDGSVTTAKIADGAITKAKLADAGFRLPIYSASTNIHNWQITACSSSGPYKIPGLDLSLTVDIPSILDISFTGLVQNSATGGATYSVLYVDDTPIQLSTETSIGGCRNADPMSGAPWCTAANVATAQVVPGNHTVNVRVSCDGVGSTGRVWNGWLVVRVFPK